MKGLIELMSQSRFFWSIWVCEAIFMGWWTWSEAKLTHLSMNPSILPAWLYIITASVLFLSGLKTLATILIGIPALPLSLMLIFLILVFLVDLFFGPIRWN